MRWLLPMLQAAAIVITCLWIYSPVCKSDWIWDIRFKQFVHRISPQQGDIPVFRDTGGDWLWDDDQLLTANITVQHRLSPDPAAPDEHLWTFAKLWLNPDGADYFPLSYTALWAQWPYFGMNSPGYHVTTILLHITGSLLLWRLLTEMRVPGAWFTSFLFAIHPVCVESVAWVSETKNTLSIVPFLLSAICFVKFDDLASDDSTAVEGVSRKMRWYYVLTVVFFLIAMFAKTTMVMFPIVIIAYGLWKRGFQVDLRGALLAAVSIAILALCVRTMLHLLVALRDGKLTPELLDQGVRTAGLWLTVSVLFPFAVMAFDWWKRGFRFDPRTLKPAIVIAAAAIVTLVYLRYAPRYATSILRWLGGKSGVPDWKLEIVTRACWAVAAIAQLVSVTTQAMFFSGLNATGDDETNRGTGARTFDRYVLQALPFFWISAGLGLLTIFYQWNRAIGDEKILVGGLPSRIASSGMSTLFYLWTIVNPTRLLPIYPRWEVDPPKVWQLLFPWPIVFAMAAWFWVNRGTASEPKGGRHALFVLGFFLLMVGPVLGFVMISYMRITWAADHFIYLPMIGPLALLVAGAAVLYRRTGALERPLYHVGGAVLTIALALSSFRYAGVWADEDRLWGHTLSINPDAWQAHNRLGAKKFARGDLTAAHQHFQNSTRLRPDLGETHNNLGTTLSARSQLFAQRGDMVAAKREMDAAIEQFAEAARVTPGVPTIKFNLANALAAAGRWGEAGDVYKELMNLDPGNPGLINNYGVTLYKQGLVEAAVRQFRRALEIAPDRKDVQESLAVALGEKPDPSLAPKSAAAKDGAAQPESQAEPPAPAGPRLELEPPRSPTLDAVPAIP